MAETKGSEKAGWAAAASLPFTLGFKIPAEKHTQDKAQDKNRDKEDRRPTKDDKWEEDLKESHCLWLGGGEWLGMVGPKVVLWENWKQKRRERENFNMNLL